MQSLCSAGGVVSGVTALLCQLFSENTASKSIFAAELFQ